MKMAKATLESLAARIEKIEARNRRVEADKAWEGSFTRKLLIIFLTYFTIGSYMGLIGVKDPHIQAVIPSLGFTLSTLTLSFAKEVWRKNYGKK
jgi:hypothetical protein